MTKASLINLPPETLHNALQWLDPDDLAVLPRVCRRLYDFADGNQKLCRDIYLHHYDKPENMDQDWQADVRDVVRLQYVCQKLDPTKKRQRLGFVYHTVDRLLKNASSAGYATNYAQTHCASRNASLLKDLLDDDVNKEAFLQQSFLFERVRNEHHRPLRYPKASVERHQQSAKLHCLYGRPILQIGRLRSNRTYPFACSKVYDLREYTARTKWGPFRDDDTYRVDWEKMEAILIVLGHNLNSSRFIARLFSDIWDSPFSVSWPKSFMPSPQRDITSLEARDPYGVTGLWHRIVCFLDYSDFFAYNFAMGDLIPEDTPRPAISVGEATRLIAMRIHVTSIEPAGPEDGQELPLVRFEGESRSLDDSGDDNAASGLRGIVRLTPEGEVRWTTFSIFHGQERWRSEGIQIGGVGSGRGILGNWFDRDFDAHGPAGPTAIWKASNSKNVRGTIRDMMPNDFLMAYAPADSEDSDPEAEMEYTGEDEEELDEDDEDFQFEAAPGELTALIMDAALDVLDMAPPGDPHATAGQGNGEI